MIDARDYETTEELEEAMKHEGDIAELKRIKTQILKYEYIKRQCDKALDILSIYRELCEKRLNKYNESERNRNKKMEKIKKNDRKTVIFDDFEFYGRGSDIYNKPNTNEDSS